MWHTGFTSAPVAFDTELTTIQDTLNYRLVNGTEYTLRVGGNFLFAKTKILSSEAGNDTSFVNASPVSLPPSWILLLASLLNLTDL